MVAFFSNGNAAGHVAIINGVSTVRSTDKPSSGRVATVTIDEIIHSWGGRPFRFATDWLMGHNIVNLGAPLGSSHTGGSSVADVAREVIAGKWGIGDSRKSSLTAAGYDYNAVQTQVNAILKAGPSASNSNIDAVAREVIAGQWGAGEDRKNRLSASGYDYSAVQSRVNAILNAGSVSHRTYTVQPGDSLSRIASKVNYPGGWKALYQKNRGVIGGNPNVVRVGQVLSL
jgi:LysM repeat protein